MAAVGIDAAVGEQDFDVERVVLGQAQLPFLHFVAIAQKFVFGYREIDPDRVELGDVGQQAVRRRQVTPFLQLCVARQPGERRAYPRVTEIELRLFHGSFVSFNISLGRTGSGDRRVSLLIADYLLIEQIDRAFFIRICFRLVGPIFC